MPNDVSEIDIKLPSEEFLKKSITKSPSDSRLSVLRGGTTRCLQPAETSFYNFDQYC